MSYSLGILFFSLFVSSSIVQSAVPPSKTFKLVNSGLLYGYVEDGAAYYTDVEEIANQPFKKLANHPFNLCFFAPGPDPFQDNRSNAFTLGLRLDKRLVWIAKQSKPVGRNATLTFGGDGNLVLAGVDAKVVWQTGTANMDILDIKLLPNGNMVLVNKQGKFVWESFHYPTDVLLSGQSLRYNGVNKLVSRLSPIDPTPGPYSLVMEGKIMSFYFKTKGNKPEVYSHMESIFMEVGTLTEMTFRSQRASTEFNLYELSLSFTEDNSTWSVVPAGAQLNFNATYSFVQLGGDGNLRFHTYLEDKVIRNYWIEAFTLFSRNQFAESECKLPTKCGTLGVCEDNQCVACPTPKGLLGWSKSCAPPKIPNCSIKGTPTTASYYKIVGVDHFSSNYTGVPMKLAECREKCNKDCKCKGFFYRIAESMCLPTPQLNTLTRVTNATHLGFIKISK